MEVNWTKIKGGSQSGRKVVPHDSKSDLPLHIPLDRFLKKCLMYDQQLKLAQSRYAHCTVYGPKKFGETCISKIDT